MAKDAKPKDEKPKKDKRAKGEKGKNGAGENAPPYSSIATHPKALASVRRAKSWAGIGAFAVAAGLSLKAGVPFSEACLRSIAAGIAGYMLVWWGGMKVWRHLMIAEQRAAIEEINRRRAERSGENSDKKVAVRG